MSDGELRMKFKQFLPEVHWQSIETWSTGQGVPDMNGCSESIEFWIEAKKTNGFTVDVEPHQIAWLERRARAGGRTFVAVRRLAAAGPRRGAACDEFYLFRGIDARALKQHGLKIDGPAALVHCSGGPARWNWHTIKAHLIGAFHPN